MRASHVSTLTFAELKSVEEYCLKYCLAFGERKIDGSDRFDDDQLCSLHGENAVGPTPLRRFVVLDMCARIA